MTSPFHAGEQRVQSQLGVRDEIESFARRVVRPFLPEQHRVFYAQLPFVVLAARDAGGRPWATLLAEEPGFVASPDSKRLRVATLPLEGDALAGALESGDDIGLLGIELSTRRRNRVNGRVSGRRAGGFDLEVTQSFGNCPQYITERVWERADASGAGSIASRDRGLSAAQQRFIEAADTFFIATGYRGTGESETYGMDASHRGGSPGFVEVEGASALVFPDYAGNNHFNTVGNLAMDPKAGLLFVDFESGGLLQLTGEARIDWDSPEVGRFEGARRLIRFEISEVVELQQVLPLRWQTSGDSVRELRVIDKHRESADVTSFTFASRDGSPLPSFVAGQHLPIELDLPGHTHRVRRTYSLSGAPADGTYRISVKREAQGVASRHLHDAVEVGSFLGAGKPQGVFVLDPPGDRPIVLVSAGVGLTPLVSMLHELARDGSRPAWFVHGARDGGHDPLRDEVEALIAAGRHQSLHVAYSRPGVDDRPGTRLPQQRPGRRGPAREAAAWTRCGLLSVRPERLHGIGAERPRGARSLARSNPERVLRSARMRWIKQG